ncbi:MAG: hypothetical protein BAA00_10730 [Parageobacillus thermoglucosidasius]|nr:MAG: hypothetical protein BAA00_10730 [Parageobacillus thermoglucosidasius]
MNPHESSFYLKRCTSGNFRGGPDRIRWSGEARMIEEPEKDGKRGRRAISPLRKISMPGSVTGSDENFCKSKQTHRLK